LAGPPPSGRWPPGAALAGGGRALFPRAGRGGDGPRHTRAASTASRGSAPGAGGRAPPSPAVRAQCAARALSNRWPRNHEPASRPCPTAWPGPDRRSHLAMASRPALLPFSDTCHVPFPPRGLGAPTGWHTLQRPVSLRETPPVGAAVLNGNDASAALRDTAAAPPATPPDLRPSSSDA